MPEARDDKGYIIVPNNQSDILQTEMEHELRRGVRCHTHTLICLDPTCVQLKCLDIQLLFFSPPLLLSTDDTDPAICIEPWTVCVFKTPFINAWGFRLRRETAGVQQGERKLAN